jgi:hypothetical protein
MPVGRLFQGGPFFLEAIMLANSPISEILHSSMLKDAPITSSLRIPDIDYSETNSILALFELAALQTPDPDLARNIRQVIASKRHVISASR